MVVVCIRALVWRCGCGVRCKDEEQESVVFSFWESIILSTRANKVCIISIPIHSRLQKSEIQL
jgi:hypothetical protein